jgi:DNA-binding GntR family transcriptional regulator
MPSVLQVREAQVSLEDDMPVPTPDHQTVERRSLRQIAIEKIKGAILDGTLLPGEDLHDDELQSWLGMSRTPVREAIIELTRLGLVDTEAQRYTRVATPDPATAMYDFQTVGALLGGVTRVTIPAITDATRKRMIAATDRVLKAINAGDREAIIPGGLQIIDLVRENCPNPVLLAATSDMIDAKIHRIILSRLVQEADQERLVTGYQGLRDALTENDAIACELAVERLFRLDVPFPAN